MQLNPRKEIQNELQKTQQTIVKEVVLSWMRKHRVDRAVYDDSSSVYGIHTGNVFPVRVQCTDADGACDPQSGEL